MDKAEINYSRIKDEWEKYYPEWTHEPGSNPSKFLLLKLLMKAYPWMFFIFTSFNIILSVATFFNIKLLQIVLERLEDEQMSTWDFFAMFKRISGSVLILISSKTAIIVLEQQNDFIKKMMEVRVKYGVTSLIFHKVMKKSLMRDPTYTIGEITNMSTGDTMNVCLIIWFFTNFILTPLEIVIALVWLYAIVGGVVIVPLLGFVVIFWVNYKVSKASYTYQANFMNNKDRRGKLVSEVFTNIRYIKMMGLENYFISKVNTIKSEEMRWLKRDFNRVIKLRILSQVTPQIFYLLLFGSYIWINGMYKISFLFTVMMIGDMFRKNFDKVPKMLNWLLGFLVSCERICVFLLSDSINTSYIELAEDSPQEQNAIEIKNGSFYWEDKDLNKLYLKDKERVTKTNKNESDQDQDDSQSSIGGQDREERAKTRARISVLGHQINGGSESRLTIQSKNRNAMELRESNIQSEAQRISSSTKQEEYSSGFDQLAQDQKLYQGIDFNLKDINIKVKKGACVGIIGSVGSGKSSLLSCLSGEMYHKLGASIKIAGSTSYVSQRAWIPSMTIKDSILFGGEYDHKRYAEAIKYSCMIDDLRILANRDDTMLGESGINLSGGQKIRLSIARALYSDSDIYLFDDPISALDVHVGKAVMEKGIVGYLEGKTRIVATHAIAFLKYFDYIYVLEDGRIVEEGVFDYISKTEVFSKIKAAEKKKKEGEESEDEELQGIDQSESNGKDRFQEKIQEEEEQQEKSEDDGRYRIENMT